MPFIQEPEAAGEDSSLEPIAIVGMCTVSTLPSFTF
jgi:hypothetical protein